MGMRKSFFIVAACAASGLFVARNALGSAYSDAVTSTSGLVGYWQLGETAGTYSDSSLQGNAGVPNANLLRGVAGPRPSDGLLGFDAANSAAGFDASDGGDFVSITDPANNALDERTGDLSYSLWFKAPPADGNYYMFLSKESGSRDGYFLERLGNGKLNVSFSPNIDTPGIGPIVNGGAGTDWTNAVVVLHRNRTSASTDYPASGASIYLNGVFAESDLSPAFDGSPGPDANNTDPLVIGAYRSGALENYTGTIDEVAIFNRSLSPTEISSLYQTAVTAVPEPSMAAAVALGSLCFTRRLSKRGSGN